MGCEAVSNMLECHLWTHEIYKKNKKFLGLAILVPNNLLYKHFSPLQEMDCPIELYIYHVFRAHHISAGREP